MELSELLEKFSDQADAAYVDNNFDTGEVIDQVIKLGFESKTLEEYADSVEIYINKNMINMNSEGLRIWDDMLKQIYTAMDE